MDVKSTKRRERCSFFTSPAWQDEAGSFRTEAAGFPTVSRGGWSCGRRVSAERGGAAGQPPPISAFGAVMCAYARQRQLEPALQTVQRFYQLGGTPDAPMFDILVDLAVRTGQFKRAMQVPPLLLLQCSEYGKVADTASSSAPCRSFPHPPPFKM